MTGPSELTDDEIKMLQFENLWWRKAGSKDKAIRKTFDLPPLRYYQRLHALIRRPEAEAAHPYVVRRLRAQVADHGWVLGDRNRAV